MVLRTINDALQHHPDSSIRDGAFQENSVIWGFPGGSIQGPALVGAAKAMNKQSIYPLSGVGKSIGGVVIAAYFGLMQRYIENPNRFEQYPGGPAQELEEMLLNRPPLLEFFRLWQLPLRKGFVNPKPIDDFLGEILDDRKFRHFPHPYGQGSSIKIVVHKGGSRDDVLFGEVALDYEIRKAARGSISFAGVIEGVPYDGPSTGGIMQEGDLMLDGGTLRVTPLRDLYREDYDLRMLAFLGYHVDIEGIRTHGNKQKPRGLAKINPRRTVDAFWEKFGYDFEIARLAGTDRELFDFHEDMPAVTGRTVEQVMRGDDEELVFMAPKYSHVRFSRDYPTKGLIEAGYTEALETLGVHNVRHPRKYASNGFHKENGIHANGRSPILSRDGLMLLMQSVGRKMHIGLRAAASSANTIS